VKPDIVLEVDSSNGTVKPNLVNSQGSILESETEVLPCGWATHMKIRFGKEEFVLTIIAS